MIEGIRTAIIALLIGLFGVGAGWFMRGSRLAAETKTAEVAAIKEVVKVEKQIEYVTREVVKKVEVEKVVYRDIIKYQDKEVIKYVQTPAAELDFGVDPEWMRLYNASSLACNPTTAACDARSQVPGRVTRADALFIAQEQHRLYHECRVNNNGLIDFYNEIRNQVNQGGMNVESGTTEENRRQ